MSSTGKTLNMTNMQLAKLIEASLPCADTFNKMLMLICERHKGNREWWRDVRKSPPLMDAVMSGVKDVNKIYGVMCFMREVCTEPVEETIPTNPDLSEIPDPSLLVQLIPKDRLYAFLKEGAINLKKMFNDDYDEEDDDDDTINWEESLFDFTVVAMGYIKVQEANAPKGKRKAKDRNSSYTDAKTYYEALHRCIAEAEAEVGGRPEHFPSECDRSGKSDKSDASTSMSTQLPSSSS